MSEQTTYPSLEQELRRLGDNLANLLRAAWESDERKAIEREITERLERVNRKITEATERVRLGERLQDAWQMVHGPQILREVEAGLAETLRRINDELSRRTAPAHETSAQQPSPEAAGQVKPD
ncbi:MAG: hypothetical protein RMM31_02400 [Anaerolineae bacterium]|nr:hypothetical protein [Anaerolineae bacterium]